MAKFLQVLVNTIAVFVALLGTAAVLIFIGAKLYEHHEDQKYKRLIECTRRHIPIRNCN